MTSIIDLNARKRDVYAIEVTTGQSITLNATSKSAVALEVAAPGSTSFEPNSHTRVGVTNTAPAAVLNVQASQTGTYYVSVTTSASGAAYTLTAMHTWPLLASSNRRCHQTTSERVVSTLDARRRTNEQAFGCPVATWPRAMNPTWSRCSRGHARCVILVQRVDTLHEMDAAEVQLARAIEAAGASLRSDAKGTPRPIDRSTIYRFVGSLVDPLGRRRRVALDAAAARRVLPVISKAFYDDDPDATDVSTPSGLLAAVDRVLAGQDVARNAYLSAFDTCKMLFAAQVGGVDAGNKERALCAWLACAATLRTALADDPFLDLAIDEDTSDSDIAFDDADGARWAAEAVSAEVGAWNLYACREFWGWWLAEAVPAALRAT